MEDRPAQGLPGNNPGNSFNWKDPHNDLHQSEWRHRLIAEVITDYIFVLDVEPGGNLKLSWTSDNMVDQTGRKPDEILTPDTWKTIIHPDDMSRLADFTRRMLTETEKGELECRSFHKEGRERWIRISACQKRGTDGMPTHIVGAVRDITERKLNEEKLKAALEDNVTLLREVHHRVKNNLQTVLSLIQMRSLEIRDPVALGVISELQEQIRTVSYIYKELFQSGRLSQVSMQPYLELLISHLLKLFRKENHIRLDLDCNDTVLDAEWAMPCALIVNELVTNALKYAFPAGFSGQPAIEVKLCHDGAAHCLRVSDNGAGLPDDLNRENPTTIGMQLVNIWAKHQMNGTLDMRFINGTVVTVTFETH